MLNIITENPVNKVEFDYLFCWFVTYPTSYLRKNSFAWLIPEYEKEKKITFNGSIILYWKFFSSSFWQLFFKMSLTSYKKLFTIQRTSLQNWINWMNCYQFLIPEFLKQNRHLIFNFLCNKIFNSTTDEFLLCGWFVSGKSHAFIFQYIEF